MEYLGILMKIHVQILKNAYRYIHLANQNKLTSL